jgi:hypothetical protein
MPIVVDLMENEFFAPMIRKIEEEAEQRGEERGKQIEASQILRLLLERRFGPLPSWALDRVAAADKLTLETWAARLLDVRDLEELFQ